VRETPVSSATGSVRVGAAVVSAGVAAVWAGLAGMCRECGTATAFLPDARRDLSCGCGLPTLWGMRNALLLVCCLLAACAEPVAAPAVVMDAGGAADTCKSAAPDVADAGGKKPGFGERCDPAVGCISGLDCQDSEFAAHPWCTRPCPEADVNKACDDDSSLGGRPGWCIQMPPDWRGPKAPFCAVKCLNAVGDSECTKLSEDWEGCEKPNYKAKDLPGTSDKQTKICSSSSQHGLPYVDPAKCDWDGKFMDLKYNDAKAAGKAYCLFLKNCQLREACESDACCTWHAFQYVTQFGTDAPEHNSRIADFKCYTQAFNSAKDTPLVCSKWQEDCKPLVVR
jgi:hypothetical protein